MLLDVPAPRIDISIETCTCQSCKANFQIDSQDFAFYGKMQVPPPTWCPECRLIRRLAWQGYRTLYKRKCAATGDEVISFYHPSEPHQVVRQDYWWSDKWDPKSYGKGYDFGRPFFTQWAELLRAIPLPALHTEYVTMQNSEYCNGAASLKNCYLCFKSDYSEDCAYTNGMTRGKDSFDLFDAFGCELCYESTLVNDSYQVLYSRGMESCQESFFSQDCLGCSSCIGCINLRNKKYHIFNQPYSKEDYERKLREFDFGSYGKVEAFKKQVETFFLTQARRAFHGRNSENSSGQYLLNCKNVHDSYMVQKGEDCRYVALTKSGPVAQSYDYSVFGMFAEWIYESCWVGLHVNNIKFGFWDYNVHDLEYSMGCHGSENLFGCIGIRKGSYGILNKQYSKDEYQDMVARIKKQMREVPYVDARGREYRYGEYFPNELCPWAYNETTAYELFPFTKEEAIARGFRWRDAESRDFGPATLSVVSDHIKDVTDDITKGMLKCGDCGRTYPIIKMELNFYRKMNIPIPRQCPLCRDRSRIARLDPIKIFDRVCAKCHRAMKSSYAPDRPEIVYCEDCYRAEVA